MKCRRAKAMLVDYLYGELAAGEREALDEHLSSCPKCARERDLLRGISKTLDRGEVLEAGPELRSALREKLQAALREEEPGAGWLANLRATLEPFVSAFRPALAGIALAAFFATFGLMRWGEGRFYSGSLLILGIVWGGTCNSICKCVMNGKARPRGEKLNMRLVAYGGLGALALATTLALLLPVPDVYELPQYRPWCAGLSKHIPYWVAYFQPLLYAFVASLLCGAVIARKAGSRQVAHGALAGIVYAVVMVPAICAQCFPFSWGMSAAWVAGSLVGAVGGGAVGGALGKKA